MADMAEKLAPWLLLLQRYYQGQLNGLDEAQWDALLAALAQESDCGQAAIAEGLRLMTQADAAARRDMGFEMNRLFVGPDAPKAPPYESCYRGENPERTLMTEETLRVRDFYRKAGVELAAKNTQPDDFIAFELEFLLRLLAEGTEEAREQARSFLRDHLLVWIPDHVQEIRAHTAHPVCLGMALVLEGAAEGLRAEFID
ncbi:MAG: molecular chaperone TorD family protein [Ottowia sp.]|nr:molecular chaperone TorD family protein [Ottowia sp.]